MDLFKPAWQDVDQVKALRAVRNIYDTDKLKVIAAKATNEEVKNLAVLQLTCCKKCKVSKANLDEKNQQKYWTLGMKFRGLLKCSKCGEIVCDECALTLAGHSQKTCPFCKEDYYPSDVL